ncbi:hypothetical protein [Psychrobacillus sp. FSL H8-0487]|uniref:hypothetical protein n=1 Tax=Psychrobacillus sp. FSL H8-0487 TaxID=2921391 RepID=UPI0030F68A7E
MVIFIFEVIKDLDDYKWLLTIIGFLGPMILFTIKTWIDNYNNIPLERILTSNISNISNEIFIIITIFISCFFLLLFGVSDEMEDMIESSSVKIVFISLLFSDFILTGVIIIFRSIYLYFMKPKYEYFVMFNKTDEYSEWKLVKHSGKRGYMIRNNKGVISFIQDISTIQFKEVKRKK